MTGTLTLNEILQLVRIQLGLRQVSADDLFMEDLGAESADIVNIIAAAEDKYGVSLDTAEIPGVHTARHLFELVGKSD